MKFVTLPLHSMEIVSPSTSKMEIVTHCYIKLEIIILLNGKKNASTLLNKNGKCHSSLASK